MSALARADNWSIDQAGAWSLSEKARFRGLFVRASGGAVPLGCGSKGPRSRTLWRVRPQPDVADSGLLGAPTRQHHSLSLSPVTRAGLQTAGEIRNRPQHATPITANPPSVCPRCRDCPGHPRRRIELRKNQARVRDSSRAQHKGGRNKRVACNKIRVPRITRARTRPARFSGCRRSSRCRGPRSRAWLCE